MRAAQPFLRGELIHSTNHSALSETLRSGSWTMLHCTHKHQHIPLAPCLFAPTLMRGFFYGCCSWKNLSTFCLRLLPNPLLPTCCFWIRTSQTSMMASGFVGCPPLRHFHARLHADVSAGLRLSAASAASCPLPLHCARLVSRYRCNVTVKPFPSALHCKQNEQRFARYGGVAVSSLVLFSVHGSGC
jgi:hypothetical protein